MAGVPEFWLRPLVALLLATALLALPTRAGAGTAGAKVDWSARRQALERWCQTLPDPAACAPRRAELWLGEGLERLAERDFAAAATAFAAGREQAPEDPRLALYLGYSRLRGGDPVAAEEILTPLATGPAAPREAFLLLGDLYYEQGRLFEAIAIWSDGLERWPGDAELSWRRQRGEREVGVEGTRDRLGGGHFSIVWDGEARPELGQKVLDLLEQAYTEIGTLLEAFPPLQVEVLLYTRSEFRALAGAPHWSGGVYDGKIRLPAAGLKGDDPELAALLYHECTHAMVHAIAGNRVPPWYDEGLAELFGRRFVSRPLAGLKAAAGAGRLLSWAALQAPFGKLTSPQVRLAYEQSFSLVSYLQREYGDFRLARLLRAFACGSDGSQALAAAYGDLGLGADELLQRWREQGAGR